MLVVEVLVAVQPEVSRQKTLGELESRTLGVVAAASVSVGKVLRCCLLLFFFGRIGSPRNRK